MGKGYAEGPAGEELAAALERGDHLERPARRTRHLVWGATAENPEQHLLGQLGEVDPDQLFASGKAWGVYVTTEVNSE